MPAAGLERRFDLLEILEPLRLRDATGDAEMVDQVCRHLCYPNVNT
jgi:hypothetical protein